MSEPRRWLVVLLLAGLGVVIALARYGGDLRRGQILVPQQVSELLFNEDFDDVVLGMPTPFALDGWSPGRWGLDLQPGGRGTATVRLRTGRPGRTVLTLWFYRPRQGSTTVEVSTDGVHYRAVSRDRYYHQTLEDVTPYLGEAETFFVRFSAANETTEAVLVLDKVQVARAGPILTLAPLPLAAAIAALPVLAGALAGAIPALRPYALPGGLATALAVTLAGGRLDSRSVAGVLVVLLLGFCALPRPPAANGDSRWAPLLALILLAWLPRWELLAQFLEAPLDPDANNFKVRALALSLGGLWDTAPREPVFIWLLRGFLLVTGPADGHVRMFTVLLSLLQVAAAWWVARRLFGWRAGIIAGLYIATNTSLVTTSIRGLRGELFAAGLLLFTYLVIATVRDHRPATGLALGLAGGLLALTWLSALPVVLALVALRWLGQPLATLPRAAGVAALAVGLMAVLLGPHLAANRRVSGDFFESINEHARYYAIREFAGRPGFPSPQEVSSHPYRGPRLTWVTYIWGLRPWREAVTRQLRGAYAVFWGRYAGHLWGSGVARWIWVTAAALGVVAALRLPGGWLLVVTTGLAGGSVYFLASFPDLFDPRLMLHLTAPLAVLVGAGAAAALESLLGSPAALRALRRT